MIQHCRDCNSTLVVNPDGTSHKDCPGLPASRFRILPPRPPNVAALLYEEASLPADEDLLTLGDELVRLTNPLIEQDANDIQSARLRYLKVRRAALDRKEQP